MAANMPFQKTERPRGYTNSAATSRPRLQDRTRASLYPQSPEVLAHVTQPLSTMLPTHRQVPAGRVQALQMEANLYGRATIRRFLFALEVSAHRKSAVPSSRLTSQPGNQHVGFVCPTIHSSKSLLSLTVLRGVSMHETV